MVRRPDPGHPPPSIDRKAPTSSSRSSSLDVEHDGRVVTDTSDWLNPMLDALRDRDDGTATLERVMGEATMSRSDAGYSAEQIDQVIDWARLKQLLREALAKRDEGPHAIE